MIKFFCTQLPIPTTRDSLLSTHKFGDFLSSQVAQGFSCTQGYLKATHGLSPHKAHSCAFRHLEATHLSSPPRDSSSQQWNLQIYFLNSLRTYSGPQRYLESSIWLSNPLRAQCFPQSYMETLVHPFTLPGAMKSFYCP